jgi:hypothetical protein
LTVGFGPNGQAGGYVNGAYTTVTICVPGSTTNCQTVDNVLVDTGSVGLRILSSSFTSLQPSSLGSVQDTNGDQLQECIQYGDTSYSWGPMYIGDVQIGGETASSVAVQVIENPSLFTVPSLCLSSPVNPNLPNGGNENTLATFGANGILGVGPYPYDCGSSCTPANISTGSTYTGYPYFICPSGQCEEVGAPLADQAINPVAFFNSADSNGVMITLGSVPPQGAASATGTMYFGIGSQSDNALGSATLYALDTNSLIPTVTYNGVGYTSLNVIDTGSNTLGVSDATSLSISVCSDSPFYCPASTQTLSNISLSGYGGVGSGTVTLSIANGDQLLTNNPTFAAFNNLGAPGGSTPASDMWDFGLPFFLGKTIFVGIAGTTVPGGATAPNGFYAF